jgi:hypothetical protein
MMEDLKSIMYDSQVDFEASKDFERFTDIGSSSPRSQTSSRSGKTNFREMLNESFDHYRKKVMQDYPIFKSNHYSRHTKTERSILTTETGDHHYAGISRIWDKIPAVFFESNFKVKKDILDRKKGEIENSTREVRMFKFNTI